MEIKHTHKEKTIVIGTNHPFVMIRERINPTRRNWTGDLGEKRGERYP